MEQEYRVSIEPRKMYTCGYCITLLKQRKADSLDLLEGSRPECAMASAQRHHRGLKPGHVFKGVFESIVNNKPLALPVRCNRLYRSSVQRYFEKFLNKKTIVTTINTENTKKRK